MGMYTFLSVEDTDCVNKELVLSDEFYTNFVVPNLNEFQKKMIDRGGLITIYVTDGLDITYRFTIRKRKYGKGNSKSKPVMGCEWREFVYANGLDENSLLLVVWRQDIDLTIKAVVRDQPENCYEFLRTLDLCFPVPRRSRSTRKRTVQKGKGLAIAIERGVRSKSVYQNRRQLESIPEVGECSTKNSNVIPCLRSRTLQKGKGLASTIERGVRSKSVNQNRRQLESIPEVGECPTKNSNVIPNELALKVANDFFLDLKSGSLDLGPAANAAKSDHPTEPNTDKTCVRGKKWWLSRFADDSAAPKAPTIFSEPRRIQCDIELTLSLVTKLDREKGIGDDLISKYDTDRERSPNESIDPVTTKHLLVSVKGLKSTELLDTLLTYLWRVHGIDYYGMIETAEPKGLRHVRDVGENSDDPNQALEWEKKLDSRWQDRICSVDPLEAMAAKVKIDAATSEALNPFVNKIKSGKHGWKYGCKAKGCRKFFKSPDEVKEHLTVAHSELVMELTSKVLEDMNFQNYNDPDDPGGQPALQ